MVVSGAQATVAQLVERYFRKVAVPGSTPGSGSRILRKGFLLFVTLASCIIRGVVFFKLAPMKKVFSPSVIVLGLLSVMLVLNGCSIDFGSTDDELQKNDDQQRIEELNTQINELETRLDELNEDSEVKTVRPKDETPVTEPEPNVEPEAKPVTVPTNNSAYSGPSFIIVTSPENQASFHEEPINFKGEVSPNTVKVGVKASNVSSTQVDDYILEKYNAGDTTFKYGAKVEWNNLNEGSNTYVFTAYFDDNSSKSVSLTVYYTAGGAEMGKPVIYLYPEETTKVYVNVKPTNGITISDPALNDGWNVIATPDGKIMNLEDGETYPYLFWEGYASNFKTPAEGFVVAKEDVSTFFDEKLSYLGLNGKEVADFKEFWVPTFDAKPYYFITFIDQESIDSYAPLTVSPKPDSIIRVFFDYQGLDAKVSVPDQVLNKGTRNGFTLIEWGGRLYR